MIRGVNSNFPCPICLVPGKELSDLSKVHPLRTTDTMRAVLASTVNMNAGQKEEVLKGFGLRDIEVSYVALFQLKTGTHFVYRSRLLCLEPLLGFFLLGPLPGTCLGSPPRFPPRPFSRPST